MDADTQQLSATKKAAKEEKSERGLYRTLVWIEFSD